MRRRQLLFLFLLASAQLAWAPMAQAKDGDDDDGGDDSDDDSDDDNNLRYLSNENEFGHLYEIGQRQNSYRLNNNNNF